MPLETYARKRDFSRTAEPRPNRPRKKADHHFVVQKHDARALHYDFRLEHDGVLLSWAVPKGPSLDPKVKRLAMQVEDHPVEYRHFEGVIPEGEYGAGPVIVWDQGEWVPDNDPDEMMKKGRLTFELRGEKLHGGFHLVRTGGRTPSPKRSQWLLIKRADPSARPGSGSALVDDAPESVVSGKTLQDVVEGRGHEPKAPRRKKASKPAATAGRKAVAKGRTKAVAKSAARLPDFIAPQLATLVDTPPEGDDWVHEMKLDGYRILARIADGRATLRSRNGKDWTARLPRIAKAVADAGPRSGILDGEVVVFREDGVSDFQRLQNSLDDGGDDACVYVVFDAPFLDGADLRGEPLVERKARLAGAFSPHERVAGPVRLAEHVVGNGAKAFGEACRLGLEGIVSKRSDASYESKRTRSWLKVKCLARQEFVIGGYTEPEGSRTKFGALLLGVREDGQLRYAGKVGTGFTRESLEAIAQKLEGLEREKPPFLDPPRGSAARRVHWVDPRLVGEVEFTELTRDGKVRHSTFRGLREDKPARDVRSESAARTKEVAKRPSAAPPANIEAAPRLRLTHPDRVIYPEQRITKGDLALYYARVAPLMVPHVADRPLMIVRCPEGAGTTCFHQKHPSRGMPGSVHPVDVQERTSSRGKPTPHLAIEDATGLIGLVQMGAVEIHVWGCRSDRLDCPDQLVFDLDPDEGLPAARTIEAARTVRERLEALGLVGFLKTTGGKGLHVVVPVVPDTPWDQAKDFCKSLVERIERSEPKKYVTTMAKQRRAGRIFLDYLRNARGATSVCVYSARAREGARVSTPVAWDELDASLLRRGFDVRSMPARLDSSKDDPWAGFDDARVRIPQI